MNTQNNNISCDSLVRREEVRGHHGLMKEVLQVQGLIAKILQHKPRTSTDVHHIAGKEGIKISRADAIWLAFMGENKHTSQ